MFLFFLFFFCFLKEKIAFKNRYLCILKSLRKNLLVISCFFENTKNIIFVLFEFSVF